MAGKIYITRESVLRHLESASGDLRPLQRTVSIERAFSAEARVMDSWSSRFFADLRPSERAVRDSARASSPQRFFCREDILGQLGSLAEALVSLHGDPIPEDYAVVLARLGTGGLEGMGGMTLREYCIGLVSEHFAG